MVVVVGEREVVVVVVGEREVVVVVVVVGESEKERKDYLPRR